MYKHIEGFWANHTEWSALKMTAYYSQLMTEYHSLETNHTGAAQDYREEAAKRLSALEIAFERKIIEINKKYENPKPKEGNV